MIKWFKHKDVLIQLVKQKDDYIKLQHKHIVELEKKIDLSNRLNKFLNEQLKERRGY